MRKFLPLLLLSFSGADAQSWMVEGPFRDDFLGCTRLASGQVQCSIKSAYVGSHSTYYGATYYAVDSAAYAPDRKRYIAVRSTIDGRDVSRANVNVSKASPVTVVYTFNYPKEFDKITMLFVDSGIVKDIPIKGANAQTSPQSILPQSTPPKATQPQPTQSQPAPAPAPASTNLNLGAFDIRLQDCTMNNQGGITCNKAELIPKR